MINLLIINVFALEKHIVKIVQAGRNLLISYPYSCQKKKEGDDLGVIPSYDGR